MHTVEFDFFEHRDEVHDSQIGFLSVAIDEIMKLMFELFGGWSHICISMLMPNRARTGGVVSGCFIRLWFVLSPSSPGRSRRSLGVKSRHS